MTVSQKPSHDTDKFANISDCRGFARVVVRGGSLDESIDDRHDISCKSRSDWPTIGESFRHVELRLGLTDFGGDVGLVDEVPDY